MTRKFNKTQMIIDDANALRAEIAYCDALQRHSRLRLFIRHIHLRDINRALELNAF